MTTETTKYILLEITGDKVSSQIVEKVNDNTWSLPKPKEPEIPVADFRNKIRHYIMKADPWNMAADL